MTDEASAVLTAARSRGRGAVRPPFALPTNRQSPSVGMLQSFFTSTWISDSDGPVSTLARFHDVAPDHVIAVHDEIDIPFNTLKLKLGGGEGGHNGLRDISKALGTKDYHRVRVRVGRPPGRQDAADFVLKAFGTVEKKELPFLLDDAADAVELLIRDGLLEAQQKFHPAK